MFGTENILILDENKTVNDFVKSIALKLKLEIQSGLYEFIDEDNKILYKCSSAKRVKETKELSKAAIGREGYEVILIAPSDSYINPSIKKLYSKIERM